MAWFPAEVARTPPVTDPGDSQSVSNLQVFCYGAALVIKMRTRMWLRDCRNQGCVMLQHILEFFHGNSIANIIPPSIILSIFSNNSFK